MAVVIAIVLIIALGGAVLYAFVVWAQKRSEEVVAAQRSTGTSKGLPAPEVTDFHVRGDTATTVFDVPLGTAPAGQHLIDLLSLAAVEHLHRKQRDGLPLDGVEKIEVKAQRNGEAETIHVVDLPEPGRLPSPSEMRRLETPSVDPVADLAAVVADATVSATPSQPGDLEPVADFVRLTGPTDASLRAIGVDPSTMDLDELARALFGIGGYALQPGVDPVSLASEPTSSSFRATKAGKAVAVVVLPHAAGSHPEVSDKVFAEIAVAAGSGKDDQVMLVTDKFGPYSMYEREKRSSKTVFVTRERLQAFVDSFGIG